MAPTAERSSKTGMEDYGELLTLETSILRTFCLTVNATGSELKYKIIDTLSEEDFYFPVNKAIFTALNEMHRRGDYVVYTNLEEELRLQSVDMPEDMFLEDLFQGKLPELTELSKWVKVVKDRSRGSLSTAEAVAAISSHSKKSSSATKSSPNLQESSRNVYQSSPNVQKSSPNVQKSSPNVQKSSPNVYQSSPNVNVTRVQSSTSTRKIVREAEKPVKKTAAKAMPGKSKALLASEGDDWVEYLEDLASKQGKSFETGFVGIDDDAGGLSVGLMLLANPNMDRCNGFLKQLTDQIAARAKVPCLFVSFKAAKASLRIRTLARLSGVAARDIERGRLKKDSPEWERVERNGRKAAGWLKRVFVVEGGSDTSVDLVRDLGKQLVGASEDGTGVVVIDSLEKLAQKDSPSSKLGELKEISDAHDLLVIVGTTNEKLLAGSGVDCAAALSEGRDGDLRLKLDRVGDETIAIRLKYQSNTHKFVEQETR